MATRSQRGRTAKPTEADEPETSSESKTSTLAVDADIADRIRATARKYNLSNLDLTNQFLEFALSQAKLKVQVREVTITPA